MQYRDYYKILGVERSASEAQIKRAYRVLARKYHPDVSNDPDAEKRFKEVGEAYAVLKDPEKRAAYDQLGSQWKSGQEFKPPPDWGANFEFHGAGEHFDASSFFESLFGQGPESPFSGARYASASRQADHHAKILIDLEDSWLGSERTVSLRLPETDAGGRPHVRDRTIKVKIPRGIRKGQHIRLKGLAHSPDGAAGDLYLEVDFRTHPQFRLDGSDLYIDLPVTPWEAALGAKVRLPTPGGSVELSIPQNTRSQRKLRLKGKGMPGDPPGDLYAVVDIQIPPAATEQDREHYRNMQKHFSFNPRRHFDG